MMPKWKRLVEWCPDATAQDELQRTFRPLYVLHSAFKAEPPRRLLESSLQSQTVDRLDDGSSQ